MFLHKKKNPGLPVHPVDWNRDRDRTDRSGPGLHLPRRLWVAEAHGVSMPLHSSTCSASEGKKLFPLSLAAVENSSSSRRALLLTLPLVEPYYLYCTYHSATSELYTVVR